MKEEWKSIAGYEGLYEVSNLGRVKSLNYLRTGKERILSLSLQNSGYLQVTLCKNRKQKRYLVHRLVGQTFLDNPENLPCINHIDEVKTNNSVNNLEFCTYQYNNTYNNKHIKIGIKLKIGKKLSKKVGCYKNGKLIKVYDALRDVNKDGFYHSNVIRCCQGKLKSSGGYHWQYLD